MNVLDIHEEMEMVGIIERPAISIILPFEPKMSLKSEIEYKLKYSFARVEQELLSNYTREIAVPVLEKLQNLIRNLNFNTHKKSIALFVSPLVEKVFYLDVPVEEKIVIDESFEIRDLIYSKKQMIQYLVLTISGNSSKIWLGNCSRFMLIKSNIPESLNSEERDMQSRVPRVDDIHAHAEILLDKFLHHMDDGLTLVLNAYPLPVFVMGTEKTIGHFRKLTRNKSSIVQFIHGNYEYHTEPEMRDVLKPYVADWNKIRQQDIMHQVDKARSENKLITGMENVWKAAAHKNCRLLIVEKDFIFPAHYGDENDTIYKEDLTLHRAFYIKDAVDDAIEKVLLSGGDVQFVDNGVLKDKGQIALITFF
jgi:release factor family 3